MAPQQQDPTKEYIQHDSSAFQRQCSIYTEVDRLRKAMISEHS
jgi:hypothetical protein